MRATLASLAPRRAEWLLRPCWKSRLQPQFTTRLATIPQPSNGLARYSHMQTGPHHSRCRARHLTTATAATAASTPATVTESQDTTIYALSTAPGKSAIAVIRISGPLCTQIYASLCPNRPLPKPRYATLRSLHPPNVPGAESTPLDAGALVLYFPAPNTATGEDMLELHVHGGPAIVKAVLAAIPQCSPPPPPTSLPPTSPPIRYAEPGEFARRAFQHNRLDLPQIEALGAALDAETEQQRRLAVRGAGAALAARYEDWRAQLLLARAELEALIDFAEDQSLDAAPGVLVRRVARRVRGLRALVRVHVENAARGALVRGGVALALLGAPNAGKSSLLNLVVGREAAIVSSERGTTRDIVDVSVDVGGWLCRLADMAGLRSANAARGDGAGADVGAVEREGIRRAKARALESDAVLVVLSLEESAPGDAPVVFMEPEVIAATQKCLEAGKRVLLVVNKADKAPSGPQILEQYRRDVQSALPSVPGSDILFISCKRAQSQDATGSDPGNIKALLQALQQTFKSMSAPSELPPDLGVQVGNAYYADSLGVTHRQSANLKLCAESLTSFLDQLPPSASEDGGDEAAALDDDEVDVVMAAESLRQAAMYLSKITGRGEVGDVDEVLGVIFEKFCIGK